MNKNKDLVAVKISIIYYGVGKTAEAAYDDAWNNANNDKCYRINHQNAIITEEKVNIEETSFDEYYLEQLRNDD